MNTKLTLNIDKKVITDAKNYAAAMRISLSKLIEEYLKSILTKPAGPMEIAPLTKELGSIIKSRQKIDYRKMVEDVLFEKYTK